MLNKVNFSASDMVTTAVYHIYIKDKSQGLKAISDKWCIPLDNLKRWPDKGN